MAAKSKRDHAALAETQKYAYLLAMIRLLEQGIEAVR
jgi:hypothetical protein